jgi:hypothetical protein
MNYHGGTPPDHLWLIFDYENMEISEIKEVFKILKHTPNCYREIRTLQTLYKEKMNDIALEKAINDAKQIKAPPIKQTKNNHKKVIPFMKKPKK